MIKRNGFHIFTSKISSNFFFCDHTIKLKIFEKQIKKEIKILGVTFDEKIKWFHLKKLKIETSNRLKILKILSPTT